MPGRATHSWVGAAAGATAAVYRVRDMPADQVLAAALGGVLGGWIGGVAPDVVEPATNPNHRGFAHSVSVGGALAYVPTTAVAAWCTAKAAAWDQSACVLPVGAPERSQAELKAWLWRAAAGTAIGMVAGYASHLLLDARTPRGLPLLGA